MEVTALPQLGDDRVDQDASSLGGKVARLGADSGGEVTLGLDDLQGLNGGTFESLSQMTESQDWSPRHALISGVHTAPSPLTPAAAAPRAV